MAGLLLNCLVQVNRINLRVVIGHDLSIAVNNEFSEVPGDLSSFLGLGIIKLAVAAKVPVDLVGVGSIDLDLREEGEFS